MKPSAFIFILIAAGIVVFNCCMRKPEVIATPPGAAAMDKDSLPRWTAPPYPVADYTGKWLPDLSDSTLLKSLLGSYMHTGEGYVYRFCCETWSEDSVDMKVEERFGSDSLQLIFLRGCKHIGTVMHSDYREIGLILVPENKGWRVTDSYLNDDMHDFNNKELYRVYDGMLVLKTGYFSVYGGGYGEEWEEYTIVQHRKFRNSIWFDLGGGNGATEPCCCSEEATDEDKQNDCGCYEASGQLSCHYDEELHCLVFEYTFSWSGYSCRMAQWRSTCSMASVTYMNADTVVTGSQEGCSDNKPLNPIHLTQKEIRHALHR